MKKKTSPPLPPFFKAFLFIFFLLLIFSPGESSARRFNTPASPSFPNIDQINDDEGKVDVKVRRMNIEVNSVLLDYNPPGANPAHEPPRRGNPKGSP